MNTPISHRKSGLLALIKDDRFGLEIMRLNSEGSKLFVDYLECFFRKTIKLKCGIFQQVKTTNSNYHVALTKILSGF